VLAENDVVKSFIIQVREGHADEPHQLDTAGKATVLLILRPDLTWLASSDRWAPHD